MIKQKVSKKFEFKNRDRKQKDVNGTRRIKISPKNTTAFIKDEPILNEGNDTKINDVLEKQISENAPVLTEPVNYYKGIRLNGDFIEKYNHDEKKYEKFARKIIIDSIEKNIESGEIYLNIGFIYLGEYRIHKIKRESLTKAGIMKLLKYGADVTETKALDILRYLNNQEETAPVRLVHESIGWGIYKEKDIFKHYRTIGCESEYIGNMKIEPIGTYEEYINLIKNEVIDHTPLELALVLGLSAAVINIITKEYPMEMLVAHFFGNSTMGKTTALSLAVSTFGYPGIENNGLIKTWNGTKNAILGHLKNNYGIPLALDETSMNNSEDFSNFVYQIASGQDKDRLNKNGEMRETSNWRTTILSSGEHSLKEKSNKNIGISMRLMEFSNVKWTKSAQNADALKEGLLKNYGHAGPRFVKHLMNIGSKEVIRIWRKWIKTVLERMENKDLFSNRISNKIAVVMATVELAGEALTLDFNSEAILAMLLESDKNSLDIRDLSQKAFVYICETVERYRNNFSMPLMKQEGNEFWGSISSKRGITEVCILPHKLNEILSKGGFSSSDVILSEWREKGILDCDKDKFTRKRKLYETIQRVYVIRIGETEKEINMKSEQSDSDIKPFVKKILKKKGSNFKY